MTPILHSHIFGHGKPLVLLHGYLASSHYFRRVEKRLARTHRIIALDLLGFGRSPKPQGASYTYEEHVAAVRATLAHLGIDEPVILAGHSMGALITLRYAKTYPDEVDRLILFNPPMYEGREQALDTFKKSGRHYHMLLHSPWKERYWAALKTVPRSISSRRQPVNLTDIVRASPEARRGSYEHVILEGAFFKDIKAALPPTLLVVGRRDRHVYQENLATHALPAWVTLKLVESGHHTPVRYPELTEELIRSHLLQ